MAGRGQLVRQNPANVYFLRIRGAGQPSRFVGVFQRRRISQSRPHGEQFAVLLLEAIDILGQLVEIPDAFADFDEVLEARLKEADEFYASAIAPAVTADPDRANVVRQALAGMLWSKQYYYFDGYRWLEGHQAHPLRAGSRQYRNRDWFHMINDDILSMPDKWEYPWYAAWDLAFHTLALSAVDLDFAKEQLKLVLSGRYLHPNGQVPAYEWNFSDVNPPVHAWATLFLYRMEQGARGAGDLEFLKSAFSKLLLNFTWWVNRKDRFGKNVFEGGFLGLDNISVFDRSAPLPTGGNLEQADGTAWMALFCQNMAELAVELAAYDPAYDDFAATFADHFLWIAMAMNKPGRMGCGMRRMAFTMICCACPMAARPGLRCARWSACSRCARPR